MGTRLIQPSAKLALSIASKISMGSRGTRIETIHLFLAVLQILDDAYELEAQDLCLSEQHLASINKEVQKAKTQLALSDSEITHLRREIRQTLPFTSVIPNPTLILPCSESVNDILQPSEMLSNSSENEFVNLETMLAQLIPLYQRGDFTTHFVPYWNDKLELSAQSNHNESLLSPSSSISFLETIGRDLTRLAKEGKLNPVIAREEEMKAIARILYRTSKRNVILIGEAGVGKTAVVEGLAQRFASNKAPKEFKDIRIIQVNVADLVAGSSYRGEMEKRLQRIIQEVLSQENIILFIDEIHLVMKSGSVNDSAMDIANILKPALARDDFRCIGATTSEEYERYIKPDAAFMRRFQTININEPDRETTMQICRKWAEKISQKLNVIFDEEALREAIDLAIIHLPTRRLPDKAIDLLENAATYVKIPSLEFNEKENNISIKTITASNIRAVLEEQYGISIETRSFFNPQYIKTYLDDHVIGQNNAKESIYAALLNLSIQSSENRRTMGALLFYGPPGIGKSYTAECIAKSMNHGKGCPLKRLFMSQFKEHYDISRLIGAAPGLIGYDQQSPLFQFVNTNPEGVILLENIEKAHPEIQEYIAQLIGNGEAIDNQGRLTNFRNYLFILTTNINVTEVIREEELSIYISPDLLSVMDATIHFNILSNDDFQSLFENQWEMLEKRFKEMNQLTIKFDQRAKMNFALDLSTKAHDFRSFQKMFETFLTYRLLEFIQEHQASREIRIEWHGNGLAFLNDSTDGQ